MIVEFIGASGAGKTTLMREVRSVLPENRNVLSSWDLVLDRFLVRHVDNASVKNLVADVSALAPALASRGETSKLIRTATERLRTHSASRWHRVNYTRSVGRRLGMHELAVRRSRQAGATVLVDEGTVLIAYLLFAYGDGSYSRTELERFCHLVPKPDLVVNVKATSDTLVERAESRSDRRKELRLEPHEQRLALERAVALFDDVTSTTALEGIALSVDNDDRTDLERAAHTVAALLDRDLHEDRRA